MGTPFKMKGWSPFTKVDDDLKNIDITSVSNKTLDKMLKETDRKKNPNDYRKLINERIKSSRRKGLQ